LIFLRSIIPLASRNSLSQFLHSINLSRQTRVWILRHSASTDDGAKTRQHPAYRFSIVFVEPRSYWSNLDRFHRISIMFAGSRSCSSDLDRVRRLSIMFAHPSSCSPILDRVRHRTSSNRRFCNWQLVNGRSRLRHVCGWISGTALFPKMFAGISIIPPLPPSSNRQEQNPASYFLGN